MNGLGKTIKLDKLSKEFLIEANSNEQIKTIGDKSNDIQDRYFKNNGLIANRIKQEMDDNLVTFIKPGEVNKTVKIINNILNSSYNTIWIFDAYFTDRERITYTIDWMRIITQYSAKSKDINIVFFCKSSEKAYGAQEIAQYVEKDSIIKDVLKNKKRSVIYLYQTKIPIHDRFIITISGDKFSGIAIGTSFNSLDEHHYCVHKLSHVSAQNIWNDLKIWLECGNIICSKEL
jgi:hypothetical protein